MRKGPTGTAYIPVYDFEDSGSDFACVVPFFVSDTYEDYLSFIRFFNGSDIDATVYVDVWSDDGIIKNQDTLLGIIPSHESRAFNSYSITDIIPDLSGHNFSARFQVTAPQNLVTAVAIRRGPNGTAYVPIYNDNGRLIHR